MGAPDVNCYDGYRGVCKGFIIIRLFPTAVFKPRRGCAWFNYVLHDDNNNDDNRNDVDEERGGTRRHDQTRSRARITM